MARSPLHTPFAQQHTASSSSSRVSPFQQAATVALHGLESELEAGWAGSSRFDAARLRQRYLEAFEPLNAAARRGASSGGNGSNVRSTDRDQQRASHHAATAAPAHLRIVVADDVLYSNSHSTAPHVIRARAILTTSSSTREQLPPAHSGEPLPRLRTTSSLDGGSGRHSRLTDTSSSGSDGTSMRRLQRRSSSLLAATSATASNLWSSLSALGDRSRALLCRSSPVLDSTSTGDLAGPRRRSSSSSSGSDPGMRRRIFSSEGGARSSGSGRGGVSVVSLGPVIEGGGAVFTISSPGSPAGNSRAQRFSQRLLLRSTAIRRSAAARSPAFLIDVDATDSYDDLLALDQFNVKRAVKLSVLKALPIRGPAAHDAQQQHQCHICLTTWLPPAAADDAGGTPPDRQSGAAATATVAAWAAAQQQQECCECCGLVSRHPAQQQRLQALGSQQQQQMAQGLDRLQFVCWDGPGGPHGTLIVPAPSSARLMPADDSAQHDAAAAASPAPGSSSASSSNAARAALQHVSVVSGWTSAVPHSPVGGPGQQAQRQVGPSRVVDAAGTGSSVSALQGGALPAATASGSARRAGSSDTRSCSCRRGQQNCRPLAERGNPDAVQIQQLPCGHEFCCGCIQTWLTDHVSCPVCRWTFPDGDTRLINK